MAWSYEFRGTPHRLHLSGEPGRAGVIFLHGSPGSAEQLPQRMGHGSAVTIASFDRPGYANTPRTDDDQFQAAADQVNAVAHQLGWTTYGLLGLSGGGPFALYTAARHPSVSAVALVCSVGSLEPSAPWEGVSARQAELFWLARTAPGALRTALQRRADELRLVPPPSHPIVRDLLHGVLDGLAQGLDGWDADLRALASPWPFDVADVSCPVDIWHGTADENVPIGHADNLAAALPSPRLHRIEGADHYTILEQEPHILSHLHRHLNGTSDA